MLKNTIQIVSIALLAGPVVLLGSTGTDRKIEDAAKASYTYHVVLADKVKVAANDGVVTLTGTVQDEDEKSLAQDTAESLQGVTKVRNDIVITSTYADHSDAWMAFKIRTRLLMKANVSIVSTTIDVKDGVVTLGGTADNEAQKELTAIYAKEIDWVKSIKNNIVVKNDSKTMIDQIDDASITSQVKYVLRSNKVTRELKVDVQTNEGVVTITGETKSDAGKSLVSKLAQDVHGTKSVVNNMTVKP